LTGLTWSYEWYRGGLNNLVGVNKSQAIKQKLKRTDQAEKPSLVANAEPDMELVWKAFRAKVPHYQKLILLLPSAPMQSVQILYLDSFAAHPYANNRIVINGSNGTVEKHELYFDKTSAEKFMASLYALHSGHFFGLTGRLIMMFASLSLPFFAITGWIMYLQRRKSRLKTGTS
jgi:sulfite reductase (NADPH) flavoprotein alpha-component